MANAIESREEARKENGASLMFIGLAIWVADALVVFFFPPPYESDARECS